MSLSSFDGSQVPADLSAKYEKLAAEYAKVRAHVGVLKRAVLDEQAKGSELKEELKSKDQILRKHDQEFDSLSFRNQQLTKRVTVLQEELDLLQSSGKKNRPSKNDGSIHDNLVLQEELQKKLTENMKLVTMLDECRTEFERERQLWQQELSACKELVRKSQQQEKICECDSLRRALATSEASLQSSKENEALAAAVVIPKPRSSSQRIRTAVSDLPLQQLLSGIYELMQACSLLTTSKPNTEELDQKLLSSPNQTLSCLTSYHSSLQKLILLMNERHLQDMLRAIDKILTDLQRNLSCCLNSNIDLSQGEQAFAALSEVVRSLRSASQYYHGVLKEVWESRADNAPYHLVLKALLSIQDSSTAVWKSAAGCAQSFNGIDSNVTQNAAIDDVAQEIPCNECMKMSRSYEERIIALQEKIKVLTVSSESLPILASQSAISASGSNVSSNHSNEFGQGVLPGETHWSEAAMRDLILKRTSSVIEERQVAESKLTRYIGERDDALSRMVACEEQYKEQSDLLVSLQEELATTKRNYEDQLSSLSEHMANMNDKLAAQETHIEELTYEITSKGNKKGRQK